MAHALETVAQALVLIDHPLLTATYGKYSYRIERKGDESLYSVTDGAGTITMPIRWAVGASSALGQTFILEKDGEFYESRLSWFRELSSLGPTLRGQTTHPANLNEAAGRSINQDEKACHDPHTEPSAQPADYDAKCQACHGGGKVKAEACPASKNNCVSCHMPKIELPGAHHKFIDHRIRIVKPNEPYPGL